MDLALVVTQAIGAVKALTVEGCPAIVGRVAVRGLAEPLGCMAVGRYVLPWGPLGG